MKPSDGGRWAGRRVTITGGAGFLGSRVVEGLRQLPGFACVRPKGAFYVFPNITLTGYSSKALADRLLEEAGVACLSGTAFGEFGEGHLRFSYAASKQQIEAGVQRMADFVRKNTKKAA